MSPKQFHFSLKQFFFGQIKSISLNDSTLTLQNVPRFCQLLTKRFPRLRIISFEIYPSYGLWTWKTAGTNHTKSETTRRVVRIIYQLIDSMKELVSLRIIFNSESTSATPCFPRLIRKEFYQYPPSRPYRMRSSRELIEIWL